MSVSPGSLRFNFDSRKLEYFNGNEWVLIESYTSLTRGLNAGGYTNPGTTNVIDYFSLISTGNALDFGDLSTTRYGMGSFSSSTRGCWNQGRTDPAATLYNIIEYVTISSTGNTTDFGDTSTATNTVQSLSNSTRGILSVTGNTLEYVTIASTGNSVDFGDRVDGFTGGACASSTRGIFAGGSNTVNLIDYVTILSTANAIDFGDLTLARTVRGSSNSIRGIFAGGFNPSYRNIIEYITIATTGNATDFGDLIEPTSAISSAASTLRIVFTGGQSAPAPDLNVIQYVTIATTGNSMDFGDLTTPVEAPAALSDCHGGLG